MIPGRGRSGALVALLIAAAACSREPGSGSKGGDALAEARSLVSERRYDDALARLGDAADHEAAYLAGRAWAGKAESAPLPIGTPGGPSVLKPEEERALGFYERAVAARPDFGDAHVAIAELLAPHAVAAAAARPAPVPRGKPGAAVATAPDALVDRVLSSYGNAMQSDLAGTQAADAAFQELVRRRREDQALLVRYGDFLAGPAGKPEAALAQYAQALIWKPDDTATKLKMAEIHLAAAAAYLRDLQYVQAEARLKYAKRYTVDPASPQAKRLAELEGRVREIRGR